MDEWGARRNRIASQDNARLSLLSLGASHVEPQKRVVVRTKSYMKRVSRARAVMKTVPPLIRKSSNNQQTEAPPVAKVRIPAP